MEKYKEKDTARGRKEKRKERSYLHCNIKMYCKHRAILCSKHGAILLAYLFLCFSLQIFVGLFFWDGVGELRVSSEWHSWLILLSFPFLTSVASLFALMYCLFDFFVYIGCCNVSLFSLLFRPKPIL